MQYATIYHLPAPQHALDNTSFGTIGVPQSQVPRLAFSSTISTACRSIDRWGAKTLGGLLPPCIIGVIRKHEVDLRDCRGIARRNARPGSDGLDGFMRRNAGGPSIDAAADGGDGNVRRAGALCLGNARGKRRAENLPRNGQPARREKAARRHGMDDVSRVRHSKAWCRDCSTGQTGNPSLS